MVNTGFATLDLKGIQIDAAKNTTYTVEGLYSKLEEFYNSYKFIAIANYTTTSGASIPPQQGRPNIVTVLRPAGGTFYIVTFTYVGIVVISVQSNSTVRIAGVTPYEVQKAQSLNNARNETSTDTDTDTDIIIEEVK